jgi:cation diffusion facilitator CzcD-associated flavoprotein CzcO/acetyl esterase/lipase
MQAHYVNLPTAISHAAALPLSPLSCEFGELGHLWGTPERPHGSSQVLGFPKPVESKEVGRAARLVNEGCYHLTCEEKPVREEHAVTAAADVSTDAEKHSKFDVVVVGAGFAGMYLLHRLRGLGFSIHVFETGDDVGGTWYWNRYPGARCDVESVDYSYSFDPELEQEWTWSEKYAAQPEILRYAQHVAAKYDLRPDIEFSTRVDSAVWHDTDATWHITTSTGTVVSARHYIMASGCLSMPKQVDIAGTEVFTGEKYWTSRWPHEGVDFTGKRVAVIGTGSSAIQSIPLIAAQASQVTVFQRTPNFSIPAGNGPTHEDKRAQYETDRAAYREAARHSGAGVPVPPSEVSALAVSEAERQAAYEAGWKRGALIPFLGSYNDHLGSQQANDLLSEFVRNKIRATVNDPETAEALCPKSFPIGTKRLCLDTGYYETFNLPHVRLVDLHRHAIKTITETGIDLVDESLAFDAIVFATGFDAMTGAIVSVNITGRDGITLKDAWAAGPMTYLGLMATGFPNLFMVTGPGSPSVLSNMIVSIEQHADWITDCIVRMRADENTSIEPTELAVSGWVQHVNDFADITLFPQANSWYMGANVPGKARVFLPYAGGVDRYRDVCDEVVASDYLGFVRRGENGTQVNDGVVRRLQPDVMVMLDMMAELNLPPIESMPPPAAREFMTAMSSQRAPGPEVGEVVDGTFPGADGQALNYRLYRPSTEGPHPVVVYYHGGGWVLGSHDSDDPLCRDLCAQSNSIIVSVDYRHAPEARFPAAADDAFAALVWVAENTSTLGGIPDQRAVAGWSAGGNLAAVVAQMARDAKGPKIAGQLLLTPVTDSDLSRPSYTENAEERVLTTSLMTWFWDHYVDVTDRANPKVAPLRATTLEDLPPAMIVTCEFDPLRDEGAAYADALARAGVPVNHLRARGHIHTSIPAVDMLPSGAPIRAEMARGLREFFAVSVPA